MRINTIESGQVITRDATEQEIAAMPSDLQTADISHGAQSWTLVDDFTATEEINSYIRSFPQNSYTELRFSAVGKIGGGY